MVVNIIDFKQQQQKQFGHSATTVKVFSLSAGLRRLFT